MIQSSATPLQRAPAVNFRVMAGGRFPVEGYVRPGAEAAAAAFCANFADGLELGAGFCAFQGGECVLDLWGGFADRAATQIWARETLVPVFSTSKPIATLVALMAVAEGKLSLDQPLAAFWPEFAAHGKDRLTLAQALSHQAGVPGFAAPMDPELWFDWRGLAERLAAEAPFWTPGTASGYHPITFGWLVGEPVRRVMGQSLGTVLRERLAGPLGADFHIGLADADHARCAELKRPSEAPVLGELTPEKRAAFLSPWSAPARGGADYRRAEIPSANGHGAARGVALLYSLYAERGEAFGQRLIDGAVIDEALRVQIAGPDRVLPFDLEWAVGIMRNRSGAFGPNPRAYGHYGWGGSFGLADPERRLAAAYVMNRQSHHLMGDPRAMRLLEALYSAL